MGRKSVAVSIRSQGPQKCATLLEFGVREHLSILVELQCLVKQQLTGLISWIDWSVFAQMFRIAEVEKASSAAIEFNFDVQVICFTWYPSDLLQK